MANPEHLEILKQGVYAWNQWRVKNNFKIVPDLSGADLTDSQLAEAILFDANLNDARLVRANLYSAMLDYADLRYALLNGANLRGATLADADLSRAYLNGAKLENVDVGNANFLKVGMEDTTIVNVDLSEAKNLETVFHYGPSSIGIDTIYRSRGNIPELFLRGCGIPESFIVQIPALVSAIKPIQFYSCFISYSSKDEEFAKRLYADLQNESVRCWFAPEDMKIGDKIRVRIDESIRLYDKLLLVLSENSVSSQWVEKEVETALEKEREQGKVVLFPVRLDDAVLEAKTGWAADVRRSQHIGDFREWKNHDSYRKAFDKLMSALKAEASR